MRPSEELRALLTGEQDWQETSAAVKSWAAFFIYRHAVEVAKKPSQEARRASLDLVPNNLRPHVEQEARRVYSRNRNNKER